MSVSIRKVSEAHQPHGAMGQIHLAGGEQVSLRLWRNEAPGGKDERTTRAYETVGYVIAGRARLHVDGDAVALEPGDSWVVPKGVEHAYEVLEPFTAVEATAPPPEPRRLDAAPGQQASIGGAAEPERA